MKPVGYLTNNKGGLEGEPGVFYNYILAGNGLFVQARNDHLSALLWVAPAEVRGLEPLEEYGELLHGKIPERLYQLAVCVLAATPRQEQYVAITWEGEYRLRVPVQDQSAASVTYEVMPNTVLDMHSHPAGLGAHFSGQDNRDERGIGLYAVIARLDSMLPDTEFRMGIYGYFAPLYKKDIFSV